MRPNQLQDALAHGGQVTTAWMSIDSTYLAEVLSHCGFDAVTVDLQHGVFGMDTALTLLQAVSAGPAVPMARCAHLDAAEIGKLLDGGAYGIICPSIDDGESCQRFVEACRYPPSGRRSYGPARGLLFGGTDYFGHANTTVMTWAMIESRRGVQNLDSILEVDGLDGVYVGPNDLALSLGEPIGSDALSPVVLASVRRVRDAAHEAGRAVGIYCSTTRMAVQFKNEGFDLITPGNDVVLMREAAAARLASLEQPAKTPKVLNGY